MDRVVSLRGKDSERSTDPWPKSNPKIYREAYIFEAKNLGNIKTKTIFLAQSLFSE